MAWDLRKMHRLLFLASIVGIAACAQYQCMNSYSPSNYQGYTRVPTNCSLEPIDCPRSWKSGVPQGQSTALPLIDVNFVQCHEGFLCCGYVPIDSKTGEVLDMSGVTTGSGVDLGSKTASSLARIGVSSAIIAQLEQYFGLKKNNAACAVIELPLRLSCLDARSLTDAVKNDIALQVEERYNRDRQTDTAAFSSLPRGIRTAIADVWFQFGQPNAYPAFWGYVTRNDWNNAVKELRDFYGPNVEPQKGDIIRRNNEADIIEAALAMCNRSADIVFLIDESGSISSADFHSSITFVRSIIDAFPEKQLSSENGTRFGLSLFDDSYQDVFYLSSYKSKSQYVASLNALLQSQGGTFLGDALNRVLNNQFSQRNGLRPASFGLPKILIVMTDGKSQDDVTTPAMNLRASNIVVYAVGIGVSSSEQLDAVASSSDHVKLLAAFSDLSDFVATLTASSCNEPQPIAIGTHISGNVQQDQFQYYKYGSPEDVSVKIEVNDIEGSTYLYASRDNPHPYEVDSDFGFSSASQAMKEIVISPVVVDRSDKRQISDGNTTYPIYVSVKGASSDNMYTIVGSLCDPSECTEGTNESSRSRSSQASTGLLFMIAVTTVMATRL